jgi:hypothetical protein
LTEYHSRAILVTSGTITSDSNHRLYKNHYPWSTFESAAILEYLFETSAIKEEEYKNHISNLEEISRMLFGLIQYLDKS